MCHSTCVTLHVPLYLCHSTCAILHVPLCLWSLQNFHLALCIVFAIWLRRSRTMSLLYMVTMGYWKTIYIDSTYNQCFSSLPPPSQPHALSFVLFFFRWSRSKSGQVVLQLKRYTSISMLILKFPWMWLWLGTKLTYLLIPVAPLPSRRGDSEWRWLHCQESLSRILIAMRQYFISWNGIDYTVVTDWL
jgi:hypothetical protein